MPTAQHRLLILEREGLTGKEFAVLFTDRVLASIERPDYEKICADPGLFWWKGPGAARRARIHASLYREEARMRLNKEVEIYKFSPGDAAINFLANRQGSNGLGIN